MWALLNLWQGIQTSRSGEPIQQTSVSPAGSSINIRYEIKSFFSHAIHSFFLIFLALLVSILCTGISLFLSIRFKDTQKARIAGLSVRVLLYITSTIPCIFMGYFFISLGRRIFGISLTYDPLAPVSQRWIYYIIPAMVLGIGDGFLNELLRGSEEEIDVIKQENYLRMAKLIGANMWKHIKNDFIIHTSRTIFSRTAALLSGAVIVEFVFRLPGLGWLAFRAAEKQNALELLFILFFSVLVVGFFNVLHLILAVVFDPRLR